MKRLILGLLLLILGVICIILCRPPYKGLDEIMEMDIPEGYVPEGHEVYSDSNQLISRHYKKRDNSIYQILLSYKSKALMGSDETMDEWKQTVSIADQISVGDTEMYIYPMGLQERADVEKSIIEAVFEYKGYMIMVGMENYSGAPLSMEQRKAFYKLLESIKLN